MNEITLKRLVKVMTRHRLTKAQVADLLDVSRVLVSRWFAHQRRCNDRIPETIQSIMEIRNRGSVDSDLLIKRRERTENRKKNPSYPCK